MRGSRFQPATTLGKINSAKMCQKKTKLSSNPFGGRPLHAHVVARNFDSNVRETAVYDTRKLSKWLGQFLPRIMFCPMINQHQSTRCFCNAKSILFRMRTIASAHVPGWCNHLTKDRNIRSITFCLFNLIPWFSPIGWYPHWCFVLENEGKHVFCVQGCMFDIISGLLLFGIGSEIYGYMT